MYVSGYCRKALRIFPGGGERPREEETTRFFA